MSDATTKARRTLGFLIKPSLCKPRGARLVVTANCNFKCQMCTFWGKQHPDPSLETVKYWIKEMAEFGIKEIEVGGGEVSLRSDLPDIIKAVKDSGMSAGITTNGWLIGGGQVPLPDVSFMEVSIDGATAKTHDKIRGVEGAWERAVKTVQMAKDKMIVHLNFTLQKDNYLELPEYCEFARKLGVKVSIIPISLKLAAQPKIPTWLGDYDIPALKESLDKAFKSGMVLNNKSFFDTIFLKKLEKGAFKTECLAPFRCILIFIDGDVYPCGNLDVAAGNLMPGKKFKDIYREYTALREEISTGKRDFCNKCSYTDIMTKKILLSSIVPYVKQKLWEK